MRDVHKNMCVSKTICIINVQQSISHGTHICDQHSEYTYETQNIDPQNVFHSISKRRLQVHFRLPCKLNHFSRGGLDHSGTLASAHPPAQQSYPLTTTPARSPRAVSPPLHFTIGNVYPPPQAIYAQLQLTITCVIQHCTQLYLFNFPPTSRAFFYLHLITTGVFLFY